MNAKKIEIFLTVIASGSMMKIADELGYTPSGIARIINSIEQDLGLKLVLRTNKGIQLNENGKKLMPLLRQYIELDKIISTEARRLKQKHSVKLRIGAYASIIKQWIPSIISGFRAAYPNYEIEIETLGTTECYEALAMGKIDVALCCYHKQHQFSFLSLKKDILYAVLPPDTQLSTESQQFPIEQFENKPFIMPSYGEDTEVKTILANHHIQPALLATVAEDSVIIGMIAAGMGISILSNLVLTGQKDTVLTLPIKPNVWRELGLVYQKKDRNKITNQFISYVKQHWYPTAPINDLNIPK